MGAGQRSRIIELALCGYYGVSPMDLLGNGGAPATPPTTVAAPKTETREDQHARQKDEILIEVAELEAKGDRDSLEQAAQFRQIYDMPPRYVAPSPARPVTQQPSSVASAKPATPTLSVSLPMPVPPEDLRDAHGTWDSQEDAEWYYAEMHKYEAARAAYNAAQVGTLDSLNYEEE
jgi:hypothetical protein